MTWRITVHHATPSVTAVRETATSCRPTCSKAHTRARSVSVARGAIASCRSVELDPLGGCELADRTQPSARACS